MNRTYTVIEGSKDHGEVITTCVQVKTEQEYLKMFVEDANENYGHDYTYITDDGTYIRTENDMFIVTNKDMIVNYETFYSYAKNREILRRITEDCMSEQEVYDRYIKEIQEVEY